jgi:hypothetical protein
MPQELSGYDVRNNELAFTIHFRPKSARPWTLSRERAGGGMEGFKTQRDAKSQAARLLPGGVRWERKAV